jgi:hypothetical protein
MAAQGAALQNHNNELVKCEFFILSGFQLSLTAHTCTVLSFG